MHFATKCLQTMLRCIRLISRKAALSHHCHQTSGVNNTPGEADSCKVVISLRNPWVFMTTPHLSSQYRERVYQVVASSVCQWRAQCLFTRCFNSPHLAGKTASTRALLHSLLPPRGMRCSAWHAFPLSPWEIAAHRPFFLHGCPKKPAQLMAF